MKKNIFFCVFLSFAQIFLTKAQPKVTFIISVNTPLKQGENKVYLAGDFNGWNPADTAWRAIVGKGNFYELNTQLKPGLYNYKVTRGGWQNVECDNKGRGIANRQIHIAHDTVINIAVLNWQDNFAIQQKQHTASAQVHVLSEHFDMPQLGRQRRVWIYLPKGYDAGKQRYPVIYMQDGQNLFDEFTSGYGEWGIDEYMNKVPAEHQCIIIGVDHGGDNRITEYDPYDSKYGEGRGSDYVDFLVKTLKPYIDHHYRTMPQARYTAIAGSSMGGLISIFAALKYPHIFGHAGIFSPAFWIAPEIYTYAQKNMYHNARYYFVCGDAESDSMVADMQKMAKEFTAKGIDDADVPVTIALGAQHNEKQWQSDFPSFYDWFIKGFHKK